jgi:hypothetical protein
MRYFITITILFISLSTQAQTYTTARLSTFMRRDSTRIKVLEDKAIVKDKNDDARNVKIDSLFKEIKRLNEFVERAGYYFSANDFILDSATKTYSINPNAFVIIKKSDLAFKPLMSTEAPQFLTPLPNIDKDIETLKQDVQFLASIIKGLLETIDKQNKKLELIF